MEAKFGCYWHLAVCLVVIAVLVIINLSSWPEYLGFKWPLLGWGIGVFFHGLALFLISSGRLAGMKNKDDSGGDGKGICSGKNLKAGDESDNRYDQHG